MRHILGLNKVKKVLGTLSNRAVHIWYGHAAGDGEPCVNINRDRYTQQSVQSLASDERGRSSPWKKPISVRVIRSRSVTVAILYHALFLFKALYRCTVPEHMLGL